MISQQDYEKEKEFLLRSFTSSVQPVIINNTSNIINNTNVSTSGASISNKADEKQTSDKQTQSVSYYYNFYF